MDTGKEQASGEPAGSASRGQIRESSVAEKELCEVFHKGMIPLPNPHYLSALLDFRAVAGIRATAPHIPSRLQQNEDYYCGMLSAPDAATAVGHLAEEVARPPL